MMIRALVFLLCFSVTSSWASPAFADELPDGAQIAQLLGFVRWTGVVMALFLVLGANLALRFIGASADRLSSRFTNRRPVIQKVESIARFSIYFGGGLFVLALSFQINEQTLKVIGAALAFGFSFAMKDVLAAVIAGVIIMFDRPFQVGDRVKYAGQYGDIVRIGLRSVRMRTLDHEIVTIPNNNILTDVSASRNYGALEMHVRVTFYVGADQDVGMAEEIVREAMLTSRYIYLEKPVEVRVRHDIVADCVVIHLVGKAYVLDTRYEKPFETDVTKRVLAAFRRYGILPPAAFSREPQMGSSEAA
jgi:small-conductance mechanosensitive channel